MPGLPPPRTLYVAFEVFPRPKGSSSHIASMVRALSASRPPVWLLCCGSPDMPRLQQAEGVTIVRHPAREANMLARAEGFSRFVAETVDALDLPPALAVFRDPWGGLPLLPLTGTRLVFEVNALPSWELGYRYPGLKERSATRAKLRDLELACLDRADALLTVSPVTTAALTRLGIARDRIVTSSNAASDLWFGADPGRAASIVPELAEGRWIGYIGSLHRWQGVETALAAFGRIQDDFPDLRLLVVHPGRKRPAKRLVRRSDRLGMSRPEAVLFHPPLDAAELAPVVARLELTLAPLAETSRNVEQGCCPVKILESMAAGTPVLASDLAVTRELVTHGVDGWRIPPDDPRLWAVWISRLLADPGALAAAGQRARRTALSRWTYPTVHATMEPAFGPLPGNAPSAPP